MNEFRIGNLIYFESRGENYIGTVGAINGIYNTIYDSSDSIFGFDEVSGIPLTEEWLLRMGFNKDIQSEFNDYLITSGRKTFGITKDDQNIFFLRYQQDIGLYFNLLDSFEYVHQIQNLYFALTGQELEIKELSNLV